MAKGLRYPYFVLKVRSPFPFEEEEEEDEDESSMGDNAVAVKWCNVFRRRGWGKSNDAGAADDDDDDDDDEKDDHEDIFLEKSCFALRVSRKGTTWVWIVLLLIEEEEEETPVKAVDLPPTFEKTILAIAIG